MFMRWAKEPLTCDQNIMGYEFIKEYKCQCFYFIEKNNCNYFFKKNNNKLHSTPKKSQQKIIFCIQYIFSYYEYIILIHTYECIINNN